MPAKGLSAVAFTLLFLLFFAPLPVRAAGDAGAKSGTPILLSHAEGLPVRLVYVQLQNPAGTEAENDSYKGKIIDAFGFTLNTPFNRFMADGGLQRVRALSFIGSADYQLYTTGSPVNLVVVLFVDLDTQVPDKKLQDVLNSRQNAVWPTLFKGKRSLLTLTLNGGLGVYSDIDPFFGQTEAFNQFSPIVRNPAGPGQTTWTEGYIEPGIGGVAPLGRTPFYLYGAASYLVSGTHGHDIYRDDSRTYGAVENAYAGVFYSNPDQDATLRLSAGQQSFQLRDGFLISRIPGSSNVGKRAAVYLGPRITYKQAAFARGDWKRLNFETFLLEPNELDITSTNTRLTGVNAAYDDKSLVQAALTYLAVPRSDKIYLRNTAIGRDGLETYNVSLWLDDLTTPGGLWWKSEAAWQRNDNYAMDATAAYAWAGYKFEDLPLRPSFSYRYSYFSGDDPRTPAYERFDPLFSGGQGNFVPGFISSKFLSNSNLRTSRFNAGLRPTAASDLQLDYFIHRAERLDNRGAIAVPLQPTLTSKELGSELTLTYNLYIGRNAYFQGVASTFFPGQALQNTLGSEIDNWFTFQTSLYFFY